MVREKENKFHTVNWTLFYHSVYRTTMPRRIAVIGAGASGLCAIKSCIEEELEPVCYERTSYVGGLWQYTPDTSDGRGCVMKSTVINTSKETMSYSDFPPPADCPVYMHNTKVVQYLKAYASQFGLEKYIHLKHEVVSVRQAEDFAKTGQWLLQYTDKDSQSTKTEVFDGVLVCTGHHADASIPLFKGLYSLMRMSVYIFSLFSFRLAHG